MEDGLTWLSKVRACWRSWVQPVFPLTPAMAERSFASAVGICDDGKGLDNCEQASVRFYVHIVKDKVGSGRQGFQSSAPHPRGPVAVHKPPQEPRPWHVRSAVGSDLEFF